MDERVAKSRAVSRLLYESKIDVIPYTLPEMRSIEPFVIPLTFVVRPAPDFIKDVSRLAEMADEKVFKTFVSNRGESIVSFYIDEDNSEWDAVAGIKNLIDFYKKEIKPNL